LLLKDLDIQEDEGIPVKLFSETFYSIRSGFTIPHPAFIHIQDQFIFIRPSARFWYFSQLKVSLPIVFARDILNVGARTKLNNIYSADRIKITKTGTVKIVFRFTKNYSATTHLYIDLINVEDQEKLKSLTLWK
jgi:hypothetical protein